MILIALLLLLVAQSSSTSQRSRAPYVPHDELGARHVSLHASAIDTRVAADAFGSASFLKYVAQFDAATPHQFIVHIKSPTQQFKPKIEQELQLQLSTYMPHNSFLFVGTLSEARRVREHQDVLWVGGFDAVHRVAVELRPESSEASDDAPRALVALLAPSTTTADWLARANAAPFVERGRIATLEPLSDERIRIELAEPIDWPTVARVAAWASMQPTTHWVEALRQHQYFTKYASTIVYTGAEDGATSPIVPGKDGTGSIVGIIDSGVDKTSCYLTGRIDGYIVKGGDMADADAHGTAMAVACCGDGQLPGVARAAHIHVTDISGPDGVIPSNINIGELLTGAKAAGVNIALMSFGARANWYNKDAFDIDKFVAANPDVVVVVAAGNDGFQGSETISSLGYSKNAIVVGAVQNCLEGFQNAFPGASDKLKSWMADYRGANGPSVLASLSSRGPTADGRIKPDVVAPGEFIQTAGTQACNTQTSKGTSIAAGFVAGAAAVLRQWLTEMNKMPKASMIKALIVHSGLPLRSMAVAADEQSQDRIQNAGPWPSNNYGFGHVSLDHVMARPGSSVPTYQIDMVDGTAMANSNDVLCYQVTAGGSLRATLVWTDVAGSAAAGSALVNDLNLLVWRGKDGFEWRGNDGISFDSTNTVESVMLTASTQDTYGIAVSGAKVASMQEYSLVVTGQFSKTQCSSAAKCAADCLGGTCANGVCTCSSAGGADCSVKACPSGCSNNGICDSATGTCKCGRGFTGPSCSQMQPPPTTIVEIHNDRIYDTGISDGLFAGLLVLAYLIGCFCALFCGGFIGAKLMQRRRDAQMSR